jgi:hypothetical protein
MKELWWTGALLAMSVPVCFGQFFPKSSLDPGGCHFKADWCSTQLRALKEPSLFELAHDPRAQTYRFLWLRTFHHPIAIRVDLKPDLTGTLTSKVGSGAGGYSPGSLIQNSSQALDQTQVRSLLALINRSNFWTAPNPVNDQTGTDGSHWIIEGVRNGKYHVIDRWMPKSGPAHDLGIFLAFELAKMTLPEREIY